MGSVCAGYRQVNISWRALSIRVIIELNLEGEEKLLGTKIFVHFHILAVQRDLFYLKIKVYQREFVVFLKLQS